MKMRNLLPSLMVVLLFLSFTLSGLEAQEYGKIRPLDQRAAQVIQQRDTFIAQVLNAYGIAHEKSPQGGVVRIRMDGQWLDVSRVEIVPIVEETGGQRQVTAHELFFTTEGGVLGLRSELKIR